MKPLVRGAVYVAALTLCDVISGGSTAVLLALFIVASAAIELTVPVVAAETCPEGVRHVLGLTMPRLENGRVAALLATCAAMTVMGYGLVVSALQAAHP